MIAAREGRADVIRLFIDVFQKEDGLDIEINRKMLDGWSAIHYAAMNGFANVVEILVSEGKADLNAIDRFLRTALHWACRFNNSTMVKKLVDMDIRCDNHDIEG